MTSLPAHPAAAVAVSEPSLRDIHLPPDPAWWPLAPGWWGLAGLFLLALLAGAWWWRKHRRTLRQQERVLAEIDRLVLQHHDDGDQAALASGLHQLLRRVARGHDATAARQRGEAWRETLARMPVDASTLDRLSALEQTIYRPQSPFDHAAAVIAARQWLRLALKPRKWKVAGPEQSHA
ncbi:MAG TPA: DUF4381 domain-containing protein [Rhodanobacter sp.]